ncbi:MAG TPA: hypothetical protein VGO25_10785 [Rhodanobacteraceae bacterium]|jgi:hypothetical protein|nr:hypothetical protein [Rhodanobacteraceae bacterium]
MNAIAAPLIIGVTSHRNISAGEIEAVRVHVRALFARMRNEFPHMPQIVLSSLAEGGDQLVAEEALSAGVRLIAALPMARAEYAKDFSDAAALARFDALCDAAEVIEVPDSAIRHGGSPQGAERDAHYAEAGVYVSDHCHLLLAIWDGKASGSLGGTAQIASYHLTGLKPFPGERRKHESRRLLGSGGERLAYHIVCSREQADGTPLASLTPLDTWWRTGERMEPGASPMPDTFATTFLHTDTFDVDAAKYAERIMTSGGASSANTGERTGGAIEGLFQTADWLAIHFQRRVVFAMRVLYTVAALMAIAFTIYDNLPAQDDMLVVFLLLFVAGGVIVALANRRDWHRKYLDYRALAEGLRVLSYWRRAGISLTDDVEFARDNFLQKQDVELGWVRNVMRGAELESGIASRADSTLDLSNVVREWIGDDLNKGQLEYYQRKAAQRTRTHRVTEGFGMASLCVGIGISIVLATFARYLSADAKNVLVMIMGVFSIVAGVRAAYAYKKADKELIKQYRYMQRMFGEARLALDRAHGPDDKREILRLLGDAALAEQVEWALMHRQRPLEHNRI